MKTKHIAIIIVIVVGIGAFFGGMEYQKRSSPKVDTFSGMGQRTGNGQRGQMLQRGIAGGISPVSGEIIAQDENSITVKTEDGGSKIIILSETTTINKASLGVKEDLKSGEKVAILGKENSDGSVTAQSIQLNPPERMMFRGPGSPQTPTE